MSVDVVTYGTLRRGTRNGTPSWVIDAQPHVVTRLRRIFPRVFAGMDGLHLTDTPEVAADIAWVMSRWPLVVDDDDAAHLGAQAERFRESRDTVARILAGYVPPDEWKETAEPARHYQEVAAAIAAETGRLLVADEVGLGKTLTALLLLRNPDALPAVVVTLTHLPRQWEREVRRFLPWLEPHVIRTGTVYDPCGNQGSLLGGRADVLIINYHKLAKWSAYLRGTARTVIFDEAQELRRSSSDKYTAAAAIAHDARWRVGLTATPVYNYGGEIWNVVSVLDRDVLGTRDEFLREWCSWGGGDKARVKDPAALGAYLRDQGVMIRRTP